MFWIKQTCMLLATTWNVFVITYHLRPQTLNMHNLWCRPSQAFGCYPRQIFYGFQKLSKDRQWKFHQYRLRIPLPLCCLHNLLRAPARESTSNIDLVMTWYNQFGNRINYHIIVFFKRLGSLGFTIYLIKIYFSFLNIMNIAKQKQKTLG